MKKSDKEKTKNIIKSYHSKNQKMNKLYKENGNMNIQTEYRNNKVNRNIINEQDYNYLNQTSSSLYKMRKSNSLTKNYSTSKMQKNKVKSIKNNPLFFSIKKNGIANSKDNSSFDKKIIDIYKNNSIDENKKANIRNTTNNFCGYFPRPEPLPKTINYNFSINNNLKFKNDNSISKDELYLNIGNKQEDNNILYLLTNLNLSYLYNTFILNCISFNDLFLLTKDDFIEMKIAIGPRNRIMHFLSEFKKYGKNFDFMELSTFLNYYKKFIDKPNLKEINFMEFNYDKENEKELKKNINCEEIKNAFLDDKKNIYENKLIINSKNNYYDIHKLKKYHSMNYFGKKENLNKKNLVIKNNINNNKKTKSIYLKNKSNKNYFKKGLKNYNFSKNKSINNDFSKKKNNYDTLCQKFNNINKKVNDFQQSYSKIQKYSKYIDEKLSEFLMT